MGASNKLWVPCLISAIIASIVLFLLSYWMEDLLHQNFVAASTEFLKHPRFLKSIVLSHLVFIVLCTFASSLFPKRLLNSNVFVVAGMLYVFFFVTNIIIWLVLTSLKAIDDRDPFFMYIGSFEPAVNIIGSFVLGLVMIVVIFVFRKRVLKQVP